MALSVTRCAIAMILAGVSAGAAAQAWSPQKIVEVVASSVPGGSNDNTARTLERVLVAHKLVNSTLTVVSKPGGGGNIAYTYVSQRAGDPHYLQVTTSALLSNHIIGSSTLSPADFTPIAHVSSGRMRVVGVGAPQRLGGALAIAPTWREQGVDFVYGSWRSIFAPKGLTPAQVAYWENTLRNVTETAEWKADLEKNYWTDDFVTGAQLRKNLEQEYAYTRSVLVDVGLAK